MFFRRHYVEGHDGNHSAIHGHGDTHLSKGYLVEQDFHIQYAVHRHTSFADITYHPGVIRIVTPVGGKVEGNGKPLLPHGKVAAVESVALFRGGKARILANRPGPLHIHRRIGSSQIGRDAGKVIQMLQILQISSGVKRLDLDLFVGFPSVARNLLLFAGAFELGIYLGEIWIHFATSISSAS